MAQNNRSKDRPAEISAQAEAAVLDELSSTTPGVAGGLLTLTETIALESIGATLSAQAVSPEEFIVVSTRILMRAVNLSVATGTPLGVALWDEAVSLQADF